MGIERIQRRLFVWMLVLLVTATSLGIVTTPALPPPWAASRSINVGWGSHTAYAGEKPTVTPTSTPQGPGEGNCDTDICGG